MSYAKLLRRALEALFTTLMYALIVVIFATPLIWAIASSFRETSAIWGNLVPISWRTFIPYEGLRWQNYAEALGFGVQGRGLGLNIGRAVLISTASALAVVACSLIFNTAAAYFFARLRFPGKGLLLIYVIATMLIPQQITVIPLFLVVDQLGLTNTFWALVVPFYASPFIVFALAQFFAEIPYDLDEAALLDGANLFQVLRYVVLPNALPGLLTVSLLEFQFIWNNFYWPLVAISDSRLFPIDVAIAAQFSDQVPEWGRIFAATVLASLPVLVLFVLLQRFYYRSVSFSGLR